MLWQKNPFQNSGVINQELVAFSAFHSSRTKHRGFSVTLSIYKVVYISIKDLHAGYALCGNTLEKFTVKFAKTKLHYVYAIKDS